MLLASRLIDETTHFFSAARRPNFHRGAGRGSYAGPRGSRAFAPGRIRDHESQRSAPGASEPAPQHLPGNRRSAGPLPGRLAAAGRFHPHRAVRKQHRRSALQFHGPQRAGAGHGRTGHLYLRAVAGFAGRDPAHHAGRLGERGLGLCFDSEQRVWAFDQHL